jgi:hypothetical protein
MSNARAIRPAARLLPSDMTVHLVNPSHLSFGVGVITPRWLFVLGAATPASYGTPLITDETLEPFDLGTVQPGDVVGVGIHTGNALRGYELGTLARARGAVVIFGGMASPTGNKSQLDSGRYKGTQIARGWRAASHSSFPGPQ